MTMAKALVLLAAGLWISSAAAPIDPGHAKTLTVYHVNPASAGSLPVDQELVRCPKR